MIPNSKKHIAKISSQPGFDLKPPDFVENKFLSGIFYFSGYYHPYEGQSQKFKFLLFILIIKQISIFFYTILFVKNFKSDKKYHLVN